MQLFTIPIIAHTETHKMAWEVLKRTKEVNQLQQALGDFQAAVFEERKKTLAIVAENDALKSKGERTESLQRRIFDKTSWNSRLNNTLTHPFNPL